MNEKQETQLFKKEKKNPQKKKTPWNPPCVVSVTFVLEEMSLERARWRGTLKMAPRAQRMGRSEVRPFSLMARSRKARSETASQEKVQIFASSCFSQIWCQNNKKKNYNQVTLLIKKNREQFIYNLAIFMLSHMVKTIYLIIGSYEDGLLGLLLMIFLWAFRLVF